MGDAHRLRVACPADRRRALLIDQHKRSRASVELDAGMPARDGLVDVLVFAAYLRCVVVEESDVVAPDEVPVVILDDLPQPSNVERRVGAAKGVGGSFRLASDDGDCRRRAGGVLL